MGRWSGPQAGLLEAADLPRECLAISGDWDVRPVKGVVGLNAGYPAPHVLAQVTELLSK